MMMMIIYWVEGYILQRKKGGCVQIFGHNHNKSKFSSERN